MVSLYGCGVNGKILFYGSFEKISDIFGAGPIIRVALIALPTLDCPSWDAVFLSEFYL